MKKSIIAAAVLAGGMIMSGQAMAAKTLVYCSEGSPEGFDASLYTAGTTFDASANAMFDGLVNFKTGTTEVLPGVAESWTVSEDGKELTFKLRAGVKFHTTKGFTPTRDLNADDIIFSFNRQMDKEDPYYKAANGKFEYFNAMDMASLIKDIVRVDDMTVKFVLDHAEAPIIANMAMAFASIQSAEYGAQLVKENKIGDMNQKPVGTGPFQFVGYKKDSVIRYAKNTAYWGEQPKIDNLVFSITTDASVRYQKMKAGECHVMPFPNPADVAEIRKAEGITLMQQEGLNVGYLAYNTEKEKFKDVRVRKALNYAINKNAIKDVVFNGEATVAKNPIPPTIWSYNTSIVDDSYDVEKAKALLKEAGVSGFKTNIWAMPVQRPYNPDAKKMAELIQSDWAKIGVEAEIVTFEWGEYLKRSKAGEHDTVLLGWTGDNGDPDNFLRVLLGCMAKESGSNRARWCNDDFEALLQAALITDVPVVRSALYEKAQQIFKREAPWATIAHSTVFMPVSDKVTGYKIDPLGGHFFHNVDLK
ncbi:MAG: dipeptide-binding ABC transporter substrate-binding component [Osedax symbiont Rs1]|nr:MAG: dipeptide-binding ABC transporter substrate-binding component [Osedax symbiont Rs1]